MDEKDKKQMTINLGKAGLTDAFTAEAAALLRKYGRLRVRSLKSALERSTTKKLAEELARKTKTRVEDVRGHTFILSKKR